MVHGLSIRVATGEDAEALSLVGAATMLETYAGFIPGPDLVAHCRVRHAASFYSEWLADPDNRIWLAETHTGAVVGYAVLTRATLPDPDPHPDDLEVQRIYVLSRFHGSGVGYALMNKAIECARQMQARQLVLGMLKLNEKAFAFYKRQGFDLIGQRYFQVGQSTFDDYVLGIRLNV